MPQPNKHENGRQSPADLPLRDLLGQLRASELYGTLAVLFGLGAGLVFAGYKYHEISIGPTAVLAGDPIRMSGYDSPYQESIRQRPAVQSFLRFLDLVAAGDDLSFRRAFDLLSAGWRGDLGDDPKNLAKDYRMTKRHTLRYFIPTHIDGESEEYDVDFEYEDYLPNLPILHRLPYYSLAEGLDSHNVAILAAEMSKALPSNWHVPDGASAELVAKMQSYLASTVRVRDIVLNDQILDDFARQEGLAPISAEDTTAGGIPAQSRRRYVHVVLRNEDGNWKVHSYSSFMMEKR